MARTADRVAQAERISQAVWRIMASSGPQGLTLRAVAAEAGCTTGLVLHRFPDKRALLVHARDLLHERTGRTMDRLEAGAEPPGRVLRSVLVLAASLDPDKRQEARVWLGYLAAALADEELAARHTTANRSFLARVARLVARTRPDWSADAVSTVATALVALVEGVNTLAVADPETYSAEVQEAVLDRTLASYGLS
ncbi:TetR family transcriptional regulator [Prauserella shujinwangii]|uniref:TetR family transcriptional regulator n=1 Tax=Prauserella shujinwangii TaxID=1453103 RepID=A0A2T0LVG9_9PSEU|nr:TetR/AcrR family transcriptional regulator [Prauserella shujinwangii]PRX47808.1 TetR family transcriptional regulator [Prauserella shujinwangii]